MLRIKKRNGQSVLEYIILIVIVIAALLTLQVYMKRGLQGRLKQATDDIGDQYTTAGASNYIKVKHRTTNQWSNNIAGVSEDKLTSPETTNQWMSIQTNTFGEYWGR